MENNHLNTIRVRVGQNSYPVKVSQEEEASILNIEKQVNDKIQSFKLNYDNLDDKDCLSMVLLTYAFDLHKSASEEASAAIVEKLVSIEKQLDKAIT